MAEAIQIENIPLAEIYSDDEFNCRGAIAPIDVVPLAKSIDSIGLQQPITVQPWTAVPGKKYRILSGHRRFQAFRLLKPDRVTIPAIVNRNELSDLEARKLNFEENLQRKDLNILQEAQALKPFIRAGWKPDEIAEELNQPKGWIQIRITLLKLPEEIQQLAASGLFTQEQIRQLGQIKSRNGQFEAVKRIKDAKLSGQKKRVDVKPKQKNSLAKKRRETPEIVEMIENVSAVIGYGFYTRCLAWAAGTVSDFELARDLRDEAVKRGIVWEIPKEILTSMKI